MGMSFAYGASDDTQSIATLEKALDLGINFWDTADMYGNGANEVLLSKVLEKHRDKVFLATKFGFRYKEDNLNPQNSLESYIDGSPEWIKVAVENSLKRLNTDVIDLYYAHRIDPSVPVEDTIGAMADLVAAGKVGHIGLSEVSVADIERARSVHTISSVQSELSIWTSDNVDNGVLQYCTDNGIGFLAYSPLGRGFLTGTVTANDIAASDFRSGNPRFSAEAIAANQDKRLVYVLGPDNVVQPRNIRPGPKIDGYRVVRDGLKGDETIVIVGLTRVRPGAKVTPEVKELPPVRE